MSKFEHCWAPYSAEVILLRTWRGEQGSQSLMTCSLNSLKGAYIGDYTGEFYRYMGIIERDTRSEDYSSYAVWVHKSVGYPVMFITCFWVRGVVMVFVTAQHGLVLVRARMAFCGRTTEKRLTSMLRPLECYTSCFLLFCRGCFGPKLGLQSVHDFVCFVDIRGY